MAKKLTTEEFISLARNVHGDKYGYSKTEYVNKRTKVTITCPIHGDFMQTPANHVRQRQGCPECGKAHAKNCHKNGYGKFIASSKEKFGDKYSFPFIEKEYENKFSVVTIKCNDCGNIFTKKASWHLSSTNGGCKACLKETGKFSFTELNGIAKQNNIRILPFKGTKGKREKIICECPVHGRYEALVGTILKGKGFCKKCCHKKIMPLSEYVERLEDRYGGSITLMEEYKNLSSTVSFRCNKCGNTFKRKAGVMLHGTFCEPCPFCSKEKQSLNARKTNEEFKEDVIRLYGEDAFDLSMTEYTTSDKKVSLKCNECGRTFEIEANSLLQGHGCPYHNVNSSLKEKEIAEYIKSKGFEVLQNGRTVLDGKELDIYVPERKLAIEFDGVFWHNENNKDRDYHLLKTEACERKGIRLVHVFEDEWASKRHVWESMIDNLLNATKAKIYARKCLIMEVPADVSVSFLEENHLQGHCPSSIKLGLYFNGELVSLMTFGKSRHFIGNGKYQYELLRFCNKLGTTVIGGASKLLKHFIEEYKPQSIISYADRRWSNGNLYRQLGFEFLHYSKPNYYYVIGNKRKNRFNYRKSMLVKKYGCPESMSERDFCLSQKWYRIYDCGCLCFGLINKD